MLSVIILSVITYSTQHNKMDLIATICINDTLCQHRVSYLVDYAECRYAECHFAESRGSYNGWLLNVQSEIGIKVFHPKVVSCRRSGLSNRKEVSDQHFQRHPDIQQNDAQYDTQHTTLNNDAQHTTLRITILYIRHSAKWHSTYNTQNKDTHYIWHSQ